MNINLKFLLLGTSLSLIPTLTNAQCVATTDCASLGYTQTSCLDGKGLKCPFGNTWACTEDKTTNIPPLSIGDILYADKTTSPDVVSGKTPIGIVVDPKNRLAVALETQDLAWQTDDPNSEYDTDCNENIIVDIPSLPNCTINQASGDKLIKNINCEPDGKKNTATIISFAKEKNLLFPAAEYCNNYVPNGCKEAWCGKGQWFLPSMSQFNEFVKSISVYSYRMKALTRTTQTFPFSWWTSNERNYYGDSYAYWCQVGYKGGAYYIFPSCGYSGSTVPKCNRREVLPFIKF